MEFIPSTQCWQPWMLTKLNWTWLRLHSKCKDRDLRKMWMKYKKQLFIWIIEISSTQNLLYVEYFGSHVFCYFRYSLRFLFPFLLFWHFSSIKWKRSLKFIFLNLTKICSACLTKILLNNLKLSLFVITTNSTFLVQSWASMLWAFRACFTFNELSQVVVLKYKLTFKAQETKI